MKRVGIFCMYELPGNWKYIAINRDGCMTGFHNPPVRDYNYGEWIDSTNGKAGDLIPMGRWDTSIFRVAELRDYSTDAVKFHKKSINNAEKYRERKRKK